MMATRASSPPGHPAERRAAGRLGTIACGVLLSAGHLVATYLVLLAYMVEPGTTETAAHSGAAAGLGMGVTAVTGILTLLFVKAGWLRRWWFTMPALIAIAAVLRLTVLAPAG